METKTGFEIYDELNVDDFNKAKWVKVDDIIKIINEINNKISEDCYILKEIIKCEKCLNNTIVYTYTQNKKRICIGCLISMKFNEISPSNPDSSFGNKEAHKCSLDRNISVVEKSGNDIKLCDNCSMPDEYCECKFK
jgi:hypothetical protein